MYICAYAATMTNNGSNLTLKTMLSHGLDLVYPWTLEGFIAINIVYTVYRKLAYIVYR